MVGEEPQIQDKGNDESRDRVVSSPARLSILFQHPKNRETRSSWLNCALRDDEAVYWVSIGHYEAVAVGN